MPEKHKQKQTRANNNAKLTQTGENRQEQLWQKHSNRKLGSVIQQKIIQTSNETHSKLGLNLAKCPYDINKSKRGLKAVQNPHKRTKPGNNNFGRNTETENYHQ